MLSWIGSIAHLKQQKPRECEANFHPLASKAAKHKAPSGALDSNKEFTQLVAFLDLINRLARIKTWSKMIAIRIDSPISINTPNC